MSPARLEMQSIDPVPLCTMAGSTALVISTDDMKFVSIIFKNTFCDVSIKSERWLIPALSIRKSRDPNADSACFDAASLAALSSRSKARTRASDPAAAAAVLRASWLRPDSMSRAPWAANSRAKAQPRPEDAPVIQTDLPVKQVYAIGRE